MTGRKLAVAVAALCVAAPVAGAPVRRRCADRRRLDTGTHDGATQITLRTGRRGRWRFRLPVEPGRTIKIFVLAKQLPRGAYCRAGILKIQQP
jgi:hypothetical protein